MSPHGLQQQGVALITAVMVVAFASTIGAALMVQQNLAVHRSSNLFAQDQAWWYLVGMEQWATTLLDRDREDNQSDHLGEAWAQPIDFLPVDEGALSGRLLDLQGRFNLRSLVKDGVVVEARRTQFLRLLRGIEDIPPGRADDIATAVVDWMDADTEPGYPGGAEDGVYLSRTPPYRTPNAPMESLSELFIINGIDPKIYVALLPHVALHPGDHKINVNTATAPALLSLSEDMSLAQVDGIISKREQAPYENVDTFITDELLAGMALSSDDLSTQTQYFLAEASANIGHVRLSYVSLLERAHPAKTRVIAHSRNTL